MEYGTVLILFSLSLVQCYNDGYNQYGFETNKYCNDLSPYYGDQPNGDINLDQIAGIWYGVEKIPHMKEYRKDYTPECFYIDIKEMYAEPTPPTPYPPLKNSMYYNRQQYGMHEHYRVRHFVLEWHEGIWQDDYHIKVNTSYKGFWATDVPNKSVGDMYRFFGGVIQVLKVSHNHLVLNFCMRLPTSKIFSVVFSRNENQLTPEDLTSIHNVFILKNLSTSALKRVCDNSAPKFTLSTLFLVLIAFSMFRSRI